MDNPATTAPDAHHEAPMGLYYKIYAALMVLLVMTVAVAYYNLGSWNLPIAMTIAVVKALLVITYFMHMRYTGKLMWIYTSVAFVWLAMMIISIIIDVKMRGL